MKRRLAGYRKYISTVLWLLVLACLLVIARPIITEADRGEAITFTNVPFLVTKQYADISGAVASPGLYQISGNMRVAELISAAGGMTAEADLALVAKDVNLAKLLLDQDKIYIPFRSQLGNDDSSLSQMAKVSINGASIDELESLPGIGGALAQVIIDHRPYAAVADLLNVPGIGSAKYNQLLALVSL